jgi:hypothetical protein
MSRRRSRSVDLRGRPPIPEHLRRFHIPDWLTERERTVGARDDNEAVAIGVDCYRRWRRARDEWGIANGYSVGEWWEASDASGP